LIYMLGYNMLHRLKAFTRANSRAIIGIWKRKKMLQLGFITVFIWLKFV
jgi:hypothetical protein